MNLGRFEAWLVLKEEALALREEEARDDEYDEWTAYSYADVLHNRRQELQDVIHKLKEVK